MVSNIVNNQISCSVINIRKNITLLLDVGNF